MGKWRVSPPGHGNEQFYLLAVELKRLGMNAEAARTNIAAGGYLWTLAGRAARNRYPRSCAAWDRQGTAA